MYNDARYEAYKAYEAKIQPTVKAFEARQQLLVRGFSSADIDFMQDPENLEAARRLKSFWALQGKSVSLQEAIRAYMAGERPGIGAFEVGGKSWIQRKWEQQGGTGIWHEQTGVHWTQYGTIEFDRPPVAYEAPTYRPPTAPKEPEFYPEPRYELGWYGFLRELEPEVPYPRFKWTEKMFPELLRKYKAMQPVPEPFMTEVEAKAAAVKKEASWREFLKKYPFKKEWWRMAPYERGERPGVFAPKIRTVSF